MTVTADSIRKGALDKQLTALYGANALVMQRTRYAELVERFNRRFPDAKEVSLFSTPGRTEVGGNHTDHNAGRVLAAAVDLDVVSAAAPCAQNTATVASEGFPEFTVDLTSLAPAEKERYESSALVRGVCSRMKELGHTIGGFNACTDGRVPKGSGLSSSAAFEVMMVTIVDHLYNQGKIDPVTSAQIAQYAENKFFGKPCGLMDQTTCATGGFVFIDFNDFAKPVVEKVDFDFARSGFSLVIVNTGGSHADLNEDYAALEHEMKAVAKALGADVLRRVAPSAVIESAGKLRRAGNDRAILRAIHFHGDDARVPKQVAALRSGKFREFLDLIIESGRSSWMLCQNCYSSSNPKEQGITVALAISEALLAGTGAWRVHGGGFAGTIQAFVPAAQLDAYVTAMDGIFGTGSCHRLMIRSQGTMKIQ